MGISVRDRDLAFSLSISPRSGNFGPWPGHVAHSTVNGDEKWKTDHSAIRSMRLWPCDTLVYGLFTVLVRHRSPKYKYLYNFFPAVISITMNGF